MSFKPKPIMSMPMPIMPMPMSSEHDHMPQYDKLKVIDKNAARLIDSRKKQLQTAFHIACKQSNLQIVKNLLAQGVDVNAEDNVSICFIELVGM